jgi:hypothetical protein
MKVKFFLVLIPIFVLGMLFVSPATAQPSAANNTFVWDYIQRPCVSSVLLSDGNGPARIVCNSIAGGRQALISVPNPWITGRSPQLSLVNIPTFFRLDWDPQSTGVKDTAPLTISYPIGNPTDRLVNLRVQLRLLPGNQYSVSPSEGFSINNVALKRVSPGPQIYKNDDSRPTYICDPNINTLLSVSDEHGGLNCEDIHKLLDAAPITVPSMGTPERYEGWLELAPNDFVAFSPYASIRGAGADRGSPAFQISSTTSFTVEARVLWDEHREKLTRTVTDCDWSYWDDYDFIDWDRWPNPIYCKNDVVIEWPIVCRPSGSPSCIYGHPDNWWQTLGTFEASVIRHPDGTYGKTFDFVSVQSQALLKSP